MNILFLVKFYEPFDRGGSEWSTHDLAKLLIERGHKVTIYTPNYGAKKEEILDGIVIKRFHFFKKLKNPKSEITPWWTNNIVWFIYTTIICTLLVKRENFDVIHAHSNEFLPATVIAGALTKTQTVATFRDYQSICSFGFCLWQRQKACDLLKYLTYEFKFFYDNYVFNKNIVKFSILYLAAIRSWLMTKIIFFFAARIEHKVAVSKQLAKIFRANGITKMMTIHNAVIVNTFSKNPKDEIVYIGKFSKGKGVDLLMDLVEEIALKFPNLNFRFIGSGVLGMKLLEKVKNQKLESKVIFTGRVDHRLAINFAAEASLVIVPSIWPEPLPRSAIEAILAGTPVVATKVGGIEEVIKNNIYGVLVNPDKNSLKAAIIRAFEKRDTYKRNIANDLKTLKEHFSNDSVQKYLEVYQTK